MGDGLLAFVLGVVVLCGAWGLAKAFRTTPSHAAVRRSLAGFAVLCAAHPRLFGESIMAAARYDFPVDGLPFLPGAILVGILLGVVISGRVVPRAVPPAPQAAPVVQPEPA